MKEVAIRIKGLSSGKATIVREVDDDKTDEDIRKEVRAELRLDDSIEIIVEPVIHFTLPEGDMPDSIF